ncbi:MAG TPA: Nudix family hydrolase [Burkholderiaceae bacterium]|nr:Nudix family hydrolase [Burkholderiaceae bacterium]
MAGSASSTQSAAAPRAPIDVAVGVLVRHDGAVLFGQRLAGKPYAGWWEFPGGKLEASETVTQALARELHEELGIEIEGSSRWVVREHVYPHAHVRLHFHRIDAWRRQVRSREGQALRWLRPESIDAAPLLPAAIQVVGWLRLPPQHAISSATELGDQRFIESLDARLAAGLRMIQLREPGMPEQRYGARLVVNSVHPASYWLAAGGVHLRAADLMRCDLRPPLRWVGASCHDEAELARACAIGAGYALLGPVLPTASHPGTGGIGWQRFEQIASPASIPVYALGGVGPADAARARRAGAHGVAFKRAIERI